MRKRITYCVMSRVYLTKKSLNWKNNPRTAMTLKRFKSFTKKKKSFNIASILSRSAESTSSGRSVSFTTLPQISCGIKP